MRGFALALAVSLSIVALGVDEAEACSLFTPREFFTNPAHADDVTAPTLTGVTYVVARFDGGCEGTGAITMNVVAGDDRTAAAELGFEVSVVTGGDDLFGVPIGVRHYWWSTNELIVHFNDIGQALDLELDVTAVDLNGNRSGTVRVHVVADQVEEPEEPESGGCATSGAGASQAGSLLVVLAALVAVGRRGRRARLRVGTGLAAAAAFCSVLLTGAPRAHACSPATPDEHVLDPAHADDVTPPSPIANVTYEVSHSDDGACSGNGDCGSGGYVVIRFEASDDRTSIERLAFEVRPLTADRDGLIILPGAWDHVRNNEILLFGGDGDIDLAVEITTVDLNGNRSEPVIVQLEGHEGLGCAASGLRGSHTSAILIVLAALVAIRRRGAWARRGVLPRRA